MPYIAGSCWGFGGGHHSQPPLPTLILWVSDIIEALTCVAKMLEALGEWEAAEMGNDIWEMFPLTGNAFWKVKGGSTGPVQSKEPISRVAIYPLPVQFGFMPVFQ